MYFSSFANDFKKDEIKISIQKFEFKTGKHVVHCERVDKMKYADNYLDRKLFAVNIMLSHFIPVEKDDPEEQDNDNDNDDDNDQNDDDGEDKDAVVADWQKDETSEPKMTLGELEE